MAKHQEKNQDEEKDLELARLRAENAELKAKEDARIADKGNVFMEEMRKIQKAGQKASANKIDYKDIHHPQISLWRRDGKQIGPMHPANAESTLVRFYDVGILLSTRKPTESEIAAYKETPEYKKIEAALKAKRTLRERSRKPDEIKRLADLLTSMGVAKNAINDIKKPEEVIPVHTMVGAET